MSDLNEQQSSQSVKITGSNSGGVETNYVAADASGNLNTTDAAGGPVTPGTVASKSLLIGAQFNTSLPSLTTGQQASIQVDASGRLIVAPHTVFLAPLVSMATSQYTVGTSSVQLTPSPLSNRNSVSIKVVTNSKSDYVYVGPTSGVTRSTGYLLFNGDSVQMDVTGSQAIWAIGTSAGQKVYVLEVGS